MGDSPIEKAFARNAELHHIQIVPKFSERIGILDYYGEIEALAVKYGLGKHWKGGSHAHRWDHAREAGMDTFADNRFDEYSTKFDTPIAAHTFMRRLNQDTEARYTAKVPEQGIGLAGLSLVGRLG